MWTKGVGESRGVRKMALGFVFGLWSVVCAVSGEVLAWMSVSGGKWGFKRCFIGCEVLSLASSRCFTGLLAKIVLFVLCSIRGILNMPLPSPPRPRHVLRFYRLVNNDDDDNNRERRFATQASGSAATSTEVRVLYGLGFCVCHCYVPP